jgi:predicted dehydrogenase
VEEYGCKAYKSYQDMLKGEEVDCVIICTPPATHLAISTFFLNNGVHVMCEKPITIKVKEAEKLVELADKKKLCLMMAAKFRYVGDVIKAKSMVESGILGEIVLFENLFCSNVSMAGRWNSQKEMSGGGVLIDNGCHSGDIIRYFCGPIKQVQAQEGKRVRGLTVEETVALHVRTESGVMGTIDLSWSIFKDRESYISIYGTEGTLSVGWGQSKYRQSEKLDWINFGNGYNKYEAFSRQLTNFVHSIEGIEEPLITSQDALESVRVINAAYKSLNQDKWAEV